MKTSQDSIRNRVAKEQCAQKRHSSMFEPNRGSIYSCPVCPAHCSANKQGVSQQSIIVSCGNCHRDLVKKSEKYRFSTSLGLNEPSLFFKILACSSKSRCMAWGSV